MCDIIGANILNIAHQDYDPQGASVTMLIAEEAVKLPGIPNTPAPGPLPEVILALPRLLMPKFVG